MTIELRPLGVKCNIQCHYCYQNPQREAGAIPHSYDMDSMKAGIGKMGSAFTLFGGEPLLIPINDLEELWSWGLQQFGRNSLQTNGALINDRHIEMFKRLKVSVGMSIDGPGELNDIRWAGTLEGTRRTTARTERALARLCEEGLIPSLIVTLQRGNAIAEKLELLCSWFFELEATGVRSVRLHLLEIESNSVRERYALSASENLAALLRIEAAAKELKSLRISLFDDMRKLLRGDDRRASCVWKGCDPYTTKAVQGIEGNGQSSNCGRTNKDGIDFVKGDTPGFERYLSLYQTPQSVGGCAGCRFFSMCRGQCPGTAIDGDWRNRTEHCEAWKGLFVHLESEMVEKKQWVLSRSKHRTAVERYMLSVWSEGRSVGIVEAMKALGIDPSKSGIGHADKC